MVPDRPPGPGGHAKAGASHAGDRALAQAVLAGSTEAWHEFVQKYSRLILAVIHRYVPRQQMDEARSLYVAVLESVYRTKLASYEGRASLSTWLVMVTRNAVVDDLRRRLGGRSLQAAVRALDPVERDVFRHYYIEGLSFGAVRRVVRDRGAMLTTEDLLGVLRRIETRLDGRFARRLSYDLHAQSVAGASGRLLEYMDHARFEFEERQEDERADLEQLDRETRLTLQRVQDELEQLPEEDRRLLSLRFERGWSARRIATELGLDGQRTVYTWIARVVRGLRTRLSNAPVRREAAAPPAGPVAGPPRPTIVPNEDRSPGDSR